MTRCELCRVRVLCLNSVKVWSYVQLQLCMTITYTCVQKDMQRLFVKLFI